MRPARVRHRRDIGRLHQHPHRRPPAARRARPAGRDEGQAGGRHPVRRRRRDDSRRTRAGRHKGCRRGDRNRPPRARRRRLHGHDRVGGDHRGGHELAHRRGLRDRLGTRHREGHVRGGRPRGLRLVRQELRARGQPLRRPQPDRPARVPAPRHLGNQEPLGARPDLQRRGVPMSARVLIVGGGVAGLETLAALHALAGYRVEVTILAPEVKFINHSMSVEQPFKPQRVRGIKLEQAARQFHARWHQGSLDRVEHQQRFVITKAGDRLHYDKLVLATGARYEPDFSDSLTYRDGRDGPNYRYLLKQLAQGDVDRVAFVKPPGPSWPLPLYDLALMTAAHCSVSDRSEVELSLVTPEEEPLAAFGKHASDAIRDLLHATGVTLYASSYGNAGRPGWLEIAPGDRRIRVDRIVSEPRLVGHRVPGIPFDYDTFIPTDAHGRVNGLEDVFAA